MKATITLLVLKSPWQFFRLSYSAMGILKQMKTTHHLDFKKQGRWTRHYTMSLWKNEEDLQAFARSGAHLEAMKKSASIAKEIRTLTYDTDRLPDWRTAKELLETKGKVIQY